MFAKGGLTFFLLLWYNLFNARQKNSKNKKGEKNMAKKYPGLYLYFDWIDALSGIPAGKAMAVIKNLSDYTRYGTEPTPLTGTAGSLQTIFLAQLTRSKINAENGKKGGAPTHKAPSATSVSTPIKKPAFEDLPPDLTSDDFDSLDDYVKYIRARCGKL